MHATALDFILLKPTVGNSPPGKQLTRAIRVIIHVVHSELELVIHSAHLHIGTTGGKSTIIGKTRPLDIMDPLYQQTIKRKLKIHRTITHHL